MTHKQAATAKFPNAKASRDPDGYTVTADGSRLAWAPSAAEAWRIAAHQPVRG